MDLESNEYVYLLECGGIYKIGITSNIKQRVATISAHCPIPVKCICLVKHDNARRYELYLHGKFASVRSNGEWFKLDQDAVCFIKQQMLNPPSVEEIKRLTEKPKVIKLIKTIPVITPVKANTVAAGNIHKPIENTNGIKLLGDGERYEPVRAAAKARGINYDTFRSWISRHKIPTRHDLELRGALIRSTDADGYKPGGRGRPRTIKTDATV